MRSRSVQVEIFLHQRTMTTTDVPMPLSFDLPLRHGSYKYLRAEHILNSPVLTEMCLSWVITSVTAEPISVSSVPVRPSGGSTVRPPVCWHCSSDQPQTSLSRATTA